MSDFPYRLGKLPHKYTVVSDGIPDDEPTFVFRAKDRLSVVALSAYREVLRSHGLSDMARDVDGWMGAFRDWQACNPTKLPD